MDGIRATQMQNSILGLLADKLKKAQQFAVAPGGYANPPAEILLNLLGVPAVQQTMERMAYGEPLTTGRGMTTQIRPEVAEAALTLLPVAGKTAQVAERGAMAAGRAGERMAERVVPQIMERGGMPAGLLQDLAQGSRSNVIRNNEVAAPTNLLDYRGSHTAPGPDFGAPLHDLTGGGQMYPADVYLPKAVQYYGTGYPKADKEAFDLARRVKGNPDAEVTMYRAVPNNKDITDINTGDWVTLSKDYAKTHGESALQGDYKIISKKVRAKDLWTNADSIHEFGYHPSE